MSAASAEDPWSSGAAAAASSSSAKANARMHRVARKRKSPATGPPGLQWVIAQDPSDFQDEKTKRSVRSQAMIQYRYRARTDKKAQKEKLRASSTNYAEGGKSDLQGAGAVVDAAAVTTDAPLATPAWDGSDDQHQLFRAASAAVGFPNPSASGLVAPWGQAVRWSRPVSGWQTPRYSYTLDVLARISLGRRNWRSYSYVVSDDEHEEGVRKLINKSGEVALSPMGNPTEPFEVFPQFTSAELNRDGGTRVKELITIGMQAFVSKETMDKWFPAMAVHGEILLSATTIVFSWRDMQYDICGDSRRTIVVKNEIINYINARLGKPVHQFEDATLMIILHLIAGEMWSCNEQVLRIHETGVARLIDHRGGLHKLGGNGATAAVSAACCLQADIICEARMLPLFQNWEPPKPATVPDTAFVPDSPLLCPRTAFFTLAADTVHCAPMTFELLCDMRDFTNIFVANHLGYDAAWDIDRDLAAHALAPEQYLNKVLEIVGRLTSLPSAHVPELPTTSDWIYESCRIASIIYASAILEHVPFSVAALPERATLLSKMKPEALMTWNGQSLENVHLSEALFETLKKSDTNQVWGDMSGVLYWVSLVGASAARSTTLSNTSQKQRPVDLKAATWVRRCLVMYATRAMIILIFQYPEFIILAQRKMLAVQRLIDAERNVPLLAR